MALLTQLPIRLNHNNRVQLTNDPGAELDLLVSQPPNTRTFNKRYGLDVSYLQQASSNPKKFIPIFSLEIKEKLNEFTTNMILDRARIYKLPDQKRTVFIEVFWKEKSDNPSKTFEIKI